MVTPATVRRGVIHGKTIELDEDTGLSDGQEVNVLVQPVEAGEQRPPPGEGLRRAFGGCSTFDLGRRSGCGAP